MNETTRPLFALYVMWHPSYAGGREIADRLRAHFGRDLYRSVGEEHGVSVLERSEAVPGASLPLPIDWDEAEFTAVVVLVEAALIDDQAWASYVRDISQAAHGKGLPAGFFPVTMDCRGLELEFEQQAMRWNLWDVPNAERDRRLTSHLTHEFCRMLRHRLDQLQSGVSGEAAVTPTAAQSGAEAAFERYLEKLRVFISHSKHDGDGESVGLRIRDWLHAHGPLDSFFDVHDIPPGLSFDDVLQQQIGAGAVVAVHTDSYSSREWCRREVIEAKRRLVPMIVVDCVSDIDPRGMAYLGNVPVVRMEPKQTDQPEQSDRIGTIVGCVLDEVFRTWLWLCRVGRNLTDSPQTVFTARPPELITLAALPPGDEEAVPMIVYPEPLLSVDEARLFSEVAPEVRVQTLADWLEERR